MLYGRTENLYVMLFYIFAKEIGRYSKHRPLVLDALKNNRTKPCRERFFPYIITDEFKTSVPLFFIIKHHNSFNFTQTQDIRLNPIVYFGL